MTNIMLYPQCQLVFIMPPAGVVAFDKPAGRLNFSNSKHALTAVFLLPSTIDSILLFPDSTSRLLPREDVHRQAMAYDGMMKAKGCVKVVRCMHWTGRPSMWALGQLAS